MAYATLSMETVVDIVRNEEARDEDIASQRIADPVVYQLVRVHLYVPVMSKFSWKIYGQSRSIGKDVCSMIWTYYALQLPVFRIIVLFPCGEKGIQRLFTFLCFLHIIRME